jgi:purine-nucleoside phosphorylase
MAEPRKPNFMKMSIAKQAGPKDPFTEEEKAAADKMAKAGGVLSGEAPPAPARPERSAEGAESKGASRPATLLERADEAAAAIRAAFGGGAMPRVAAVLGSGLGGFGESLEGVRFLDYAAVPHFPRSTVVGHKGRFALGVCNGVSVLCMQGRFHYYEGYALEEVTFPVRVLARLGIRLLILTNAAGGISEKLVPGDLMILEDHLNLMGVNPLRGPHDERLGARFPDMSQVYAQRFGEALCKHAPAGTPLKSGVYAALPGPSYETPAEIRMLARLGADAVGMSTVPEAIVASQMGLGVLGISGIANMAAGKVAGHKLTHKEVVDCMNAIGGTFQRALGAALPALEAAI